MVQVDVQICEDGALGLHPRNPCQSGLDIGVRRMRRVAQRIHDPSLHTFKCCKSGIIQTADIAGISQFAEAESQGFYGAVRLRKGQHRNGAPCPIDREWRKRFGDNMAVDNGRIFGAARRFKTIGELARQMGQGGFVGIHIDAFSHQKCQRAQIVDAIGLVGMGMGHQHSVEAGHARGQQLLAHIGRGVDQKRRAAAAHEQ